MDLLLECQGMKKIGISGHIRPDGDCVGACLALYLYLGKCLPDTYIKVFLEEPSQVFAEMKGFDKIDSTYGEEDGFDVFFVIDCTQDRLGQARKYYDTAAKTINIDHHISNAGCGSVNHIIPTVGSTCEVLYDLLEHDKFDKDIALALYIGIIHDTGIFQYSNTTPETLRKAAHLIGFGFDFPRLIEETFYQKTYLQAQIAGRAVMESIRFLNGRCVVSFINKKTMEFYGVTSADFDGIVNQLRNIKGIDCAVFMYQTDVMEYKISLRTNEKVNAAEVAVYFGGGGHLRAAGCTMQGTFHDCVNNLAVQIKKQLK